MSCGLSVYKIVTPLFILLFLFCSTETSARQTDSTSAWIKVIAELEQYYVVVDQDFEHPHLINRGDSIKVAPGYRHITVVWETIHDYSFTFNAKPGKTVARRIHHSFPPYPRSSFQTIVSQTNLVVTTDLNSSIYIDGKFLGKGNTQTFLNPGSYELFIEHPKFGSLKKRVSINMLDINRIERYNRDPTPGIDVLNFIPAGGYIQNKQTIKATATYLGYGVGIAALLYLNKSYKKHDSSRLEYVDQYNEASTTLGAVYSRTLAESEIDEMEQISKSMTRIGIGMIAFYVLTTLDGMRKPRDGYRFSSKLHPKLNLQSLYLNGKNYPFLSLNFSLDHRD